MSSSDVFCLLYTNPGTCILCLFSSHASTGCPYSVRSIHASTRFEVKQWTVIKLDDFVPCKPDPSDSQGLGVARTRDGMPQALYAKPHGKETWVTCLIIHWAKFPEHLQQIIHYEPL